LQPTFTTEEDLIRIFSMWQNYGSETVEPFCHQAMRL